MLGALSDFGRFAWGLLYWNTRKSVFRLSRARNRNPCQTPSDSGKAMETHCEACQSWSKPVRFQKVCPLLVKTPAGLRCSVNSAEVRPFWSIALRYYALTLLSAYLAGAIGLFGYLRSIGYPVNIVQVVWPGLWYKVPQAQSAYFLSQTHQAFAKGRFREGLLELGNAYEADPKNYAVAIEYAQNTQAAEPYVADDVYLKAMIDHPEFRENTANLWLQALAARGDFKQLGKLAAGELLHPKGNANLWMRALVTSCRMMADPSPMQRIVDRPELAVWHPLLETEIAAETARTVPQIDAARGVWPPPMPAYGVYYQISALMDAGEAIAGLDLLETSLKRLDAMARIELRLKGLARGGADTLREREIRSLFDGAFTAQEVEVVAAHLIVFPHRASLLAVYRSMVSRHPEINRETAGPWLSLMCAAGIQRDFVTMHDIGLRLRSSGGAPTVILQALESYFRRESAARRVTSFLPFVPLPLEVTYALLKANPPGAAP